MDRDINAARNVLFKGLEQFNTFDSAEILAEMGEEQKQLGMASKSVLTP